VRAGPRELVDVVSAADAVVGHTVQHDLPGATTLHLVDPLERIAFADLGAIWITRIREHPPRATHAPAVDPDNDTLAPERRRKRVDQQRIPHSGRVDRYLVRAGFENPAGVFDRPDPARNAKRDVELRRDARNPRHVDRPTVGARRDVVKHKLVGTLVAVTRGKLDDVAHVAVIAEPHTFYHTSVAYVETWYDAAR